MTTAIFDATYMARRAHFSKTGELDNGVIFGFLRDVSAALEYLQATRAAFCFDSPGPGKSARAAAFPGYKKSRAERYKKMDVADRKREKEYRRQVERLPEILRKIGYRNIYQQAGYEADDLIASCCRYFNGPKILVSSDRDLWQLLDSWVSCWNPQQKKMTTARSFDRDWKIPAHEWISVKAIAGCSTDDIPGLVGVGERTAAKFLQGAMKPSARAVEIQEFLLSKQFDRNEKLVALPYPGTMECKPQPDDEPTIHGWTAAAKELGMPLLIEFAGAVRRARVTK